MRHWGAVAALVTVLLAALAVGGASTERMIWTNDSVLFSEMSKNLVAGRGWVTRMVMPDRQTDGLRFQQHTTMLPVYPGLLALLGGVDLERTWPARVINVVALMIIGGAVFAVTLRFAGVGMALLAGLLAVGGWPMVYVARLVWTETVFIAFALLTLMALVHARARGHGWVAMLGAGLAAALTLGTRHAGLFVLPALAWEGVRAWNVTESSKRRSQALVALLMPPFVAIASVWGRNLHYSATLVGRQKPPQGRSAFEVVREVLSHGGDLAGLDIRPAIGWPGLLGFLLVVIVWSASVRWRGFRREFARGFDQLLIAPVAYLLMIVIGMAHFQPRYELRFFSPLIVIAVPALWTVLAWSGTGLAGSRWRYGARIVVVSVAALLTVAALAVSLQRSAAHTQSLADSALRDGSTLAWVRASVPRDALVATNEPQTLMLHTELSVLGLPTRSWNPLFELPGDMEHWTARRLTWGGGRFLILFGAPSGLKAEHHGEFIAAASRGLYDGNRFERVFHGDDGVVYALAPDH